MLNNYYKWISILVNIAAATYLCMAGINVLIVMLLVVVVSIINYMDGLHRNINNQI